MKEAEDSLKEAEGSLKKAEDSLTEAEGSLKKAEGSLKKAESVKCKYWHWTEDVVILTKDFGKKGDLGHLCKLL